MVVYEVFSHAVTFKYKSTLCSKSTIFLLVTSLLTVLLPLLVAYRSRGFWLKSWTYREHPKVHFKHEFLLHLETEKPGSPVLCTSLLDTQDLNHCTSVKSREDDGNQDGLADELRMEVQVTVPVDTGIYSVELYLLFDYALQKQCLLQMESLGFIQFTSGLPGSRLDVVGDLRLMQKDLLSCRSRDLRYNNSVFDVEESSSHFQLTEVIERYARRNVTTNLQNMYYTWTRGELLGEPFVITVTIFYPEDNVEYRPGFWQVVKWAWMQYLCVLVVFWGLFRYVKGYVFSNHLVPTVKEVPWKKAM